MYDMHGYIFSQFSEILRGIETKEKLIKIRI